MSLGWLILGTWNQNTESAKIHFINLSVIKQKGESQNGCFKKAKHATFSEKRTFTSCAYQGVRNVRFSENVARFVFLKHPFWDSLFCLVTDELKWKSKKFFHLVFSPKFILFLDYKLMSCQNDSFQCISAWYLSKSKRKLPVLFFGYSILAIFLRPHDVR